MFIKGVRGGGRPSHEDARVLMVVLISGTTMRTGGPMRTPRPAIHKGSGGGGCPPLMWWPEHNRGKYSRGFPIKLRPDPRIQLDFLAPTSILAAGQPQERPRNPGGRLCLEILCGALPILGGPRSLRFGGPRPRAPGRNLVAGGRWWAWLGVLMRRPGSILSVLRRVELFSTSGDVHQRVGGGMAMRTRASSWSS